MMFIEKLTSELKGIHDLWIDMWDMELGDTIPLKIESGIDRAKEFILILSENSLKSRWVQFESHMAFIKLLEDSNYRVIVVRIDSCKIPLRFRPFLYADSPNDSNDAIRELKDFLIKRGAERGEVLFRRGFVNRASEIGRIEEHVNDPKIRIIAITGFYGIGKTSLVKEAIGRFWQSPDIAEITLSPSHVGSRLALDLCASASITMPLDGAKKIELSKASILSVEHLLEKKRIIIFNKLESLLDDDGCPHADINEILSHLAGLSVCSNLPVFVLSRRHPQFNSIPHDVVGYVTVGSMSTKHIVSILENEVNRTLHKVFEDRQALEKVADNLYGYPLAGKLAAPLLARYAPEYLLANLKHIEELRLDIADSILANLKITENEIQILELLAIFNGTLTVEVLSKVLSRTSEQIMESIDVLVDFNIIECDGIGVKIHSLIQSFYWKYARLDPKFKDFANKLANIAKENIFTTEPQSKEYVFWLSNACRLLFICGKIVEGRGLRRDFVGELKAAAIELYQRQEYELALKYCEEYLEDDPGDFDINFHRARCLSRLEKPQEAIDIIDGLLLSGSLYFKKEARLLYAKGRTFLERYNLERNKSDLKSAKEWFMEAIHKNPELRSAYQGLTEAMLRLDEMSEAVGAIEEAIRLAPQDSYSLSLYSEVLWRQGKRPKAIESMKSALKAQPKNSNFLFRMGRFMQYTNNLTEAFMYFNRAVENNTVYFDARLSLASVALDLHKPEIAKKEIDFLKGKIRGRKEQVFKNIEAGYELVCGNIEGAKKIGIELIKRDRDIQNLTLMTKIEFELYKSAKTDGMLAMASMHKEESIKYLDEALVKCPDDEYILGLKRKIHAG